MIKKVKLDDLVPYKNNTKNHPLEHINKIKNSINKYGFRGGIKITKDNIIIVGHGRVLALKELGIKEIDVEVIDDLSDEDIKAYRIADNKTAESDWIFDNLQNELIELNTNNYDLSNIGFEQYELDNLLNTGEKIIDIKSEWVDMPEFKQNDLSPIRQIIVSFKSKEDIIKFSKLVNQAITDKTKSIWYPKVENEVFIDKRYE